MKMKEDRRTDSQSDRQGMLSLHGEESHGQSFLQYYYTDLQYKRASASGAPPSTVVDRIRVLFGDDGVILIIQNSHG